MTKVNLDKIAKALKDKYGSVRVAGKEEDSMEYISTGNLALDLCLEGGIALGYASEWSGESSSGKTLMLQLMLADAQKKYGAIGVWFDREKAFFNRRAEELGIDLDNVIVIDPVDIATVPQAEAIAKEVLSKIDPDVYKFIAIDSISAFAKEGEKADMGKKAQSLHNLFRTLLPYVNKRTALHFTNQRTFKVGMMFGDPSTTTGGEAPKYYTTYRIKLDNRKAIKNPKENDAIVGNWIKAVIIKTRMGPNYRDVSFPFFYKEGIPYYGGYARLLADRGYLTPNNKKEFNSFNQSTLKYKDNEINEFRMEKTLKKFPELLFDTYPDFCKEEDTSENKEKKKKTKK